MTTLVLQGADAALGSLTSAASGLAVGAITGALGGSAKAAPRAVEGPRLTEMAGLTSTEGAPIPRLYGRARLGGQLIWATRFEEVANTTVDRTASRGGKSFGGGPSKAKTTVTTTYSYFANLAVGICEGPIAFVRRVWADGQEVDLTTLTMRVHRGDEGQPSDPLIVAKEGDAPAYRGLAYAVFERMPLGGFGNRVPQFSFEVVRPVEGLPGMIRSVCLIPGSTEFGYDLVGVAQDLGLGRTRPENAHQFQRGADVTASLDWLGALCPNLAHVSLVVSWFGDDLRAGACTVAPRVEDAAKRTLGAEWSVSGLVRASARVVSHVGDVPAYGGTPSDASVIRLIRELKARGLGVTLYPFVMMDVASANDLPDPRSGAPGQPPYPWRGRITCDPAPGLPGSPDRSAAAADQVAAFFGTAGPGDVTPGIDAVGYTGPDEWSFRRHVLHYARLAEVAGGVDAFIVGSELVGLTRLRSAPGAYPAVGQLRSLASDVRSIVGSATKITYSADWTEYGAHVLEGGQEVRFPLDPLWADPAIDAVGIDYYPPISDWRDGPGHLDLDLARGSADVDYLRARLGSGEAFDWYYADEAGRLAQARLPIQDGAYGKPWVFRAKDLVGWWSNPHVERAGGVEIAATAWVPRAKPIWLDEIGIPAVDKGPNGPNVFPDPKSSESAYPPLSRGTRDDLVQARGLEAILSRFDPALPGFSNEFNPVSDRYAGRMVEPSRMSVWCWDARPFPAFPDFDTVWADGQNWTTGHWITGRLEGVPLDRLVAAVATEFGLGPMDRPALDGFLDGYVVDRPMSAREALQPLQDLFGFDVSALAGGLAWRGRGGRIDAKLSPDAMAADRDGPIVSRRRAQETDLAGALRFAFTDAAGEYTRASVGSRRLAGSSRREASSDFAAVMTRSEAQRLVDIALQDMWAGRETTEFALSPRDLAPEPGDVVSLEGRLYRVTRVADSDLRRISATAVEPAIFDARPGSETARRPPPLPSIAGPPAVAVLDLPMATASPAPLQLMAVAADPWPGAAAIWRSADGAGFAFQAIADLPAMIGRTLGPMPAGPVWRWDVAPSLDVELSGGSLASLDDMAALGGGNLLALQGPDGAWELLVAAHAVLIGTRRYRLSRFLRGLGGSEDLAARLVLAGATIVRVDEAPVPLTSALADLGRRWTYRVGPAGRDYTDPSFVSLDATVGGLPLRPLPPVRLQARRVQDGVAIDWIRQTRIDGDAWEVVEVPLGEEAERYELDILSGATVLRTLASDAPAALYATADEAADLGGPQTSLTLAVAQVSASVGRGVARRATIPIL